MEYKQYQRVDRDRLPAKIGPLKMGPSKKGIVARSFVVQTS